MQHMWILEVCQQNDPLMKAVCTVIYYYLLKAATGTSIFIL